MPFTDSNRVVGRLLKGGSDLSQPLIEKRVRGSVRRVIRSGMIMLRFA